MFKLHATLNYYLRFKIICTNDYKKVSVDAIINFIIHIKKCTSTSFLYERTTIKTYCTVEYRDLILIYKESCLGFKTRCISLKIQVIQIFHAFFPVSTYGKLLNSYLKALKLKLEKRIILTNYTIIMVSKQKPKESK